MFSLSSSSTTLLFFLSWYPQISKVISYEWGELWENSHLVTKASWKKLVSSWTLPLADSSWLGLSMCRVSVTEKTHSRWWSARSRLRAGLSLLALTFPCAPTTIQAKPTKCPGPCTPGAHCPSIQKGHDPTERWASSWGMSHSTEYLPGTSWGGIWGGLLAFARHSGYERPPSLFFKKSKITRRY